MRIKNKSRFITFIIMIVLIILIMTLHKNNTAKQEKDFNKNITSSSNKSFKINNQLNKNIKVLQKQAQYYSIPLSNELQDYIRKTCKKYDVDMKIILGIMATESEFKHGVSSKNKGESGYSEGIMQLNTRSKKDIKWYGGLTGIKNFNPQNLKHNIEGGIAVYKFYRSYWEKKGYTGSELLIRSLNTYNMGISNFSKYVKRTGNISRGYNRKVLKANKQLKLKINE